MIELIQGSIFDRKCDLLIVPCDSAGGVTNSVSTNLRERELSTCVGSIPYGSVHFVQAKYEFASTLGYAASVDASTATANADKIVSIARAVLHYATHNQIRAINMPLLGTGAGGLAPATSFHALHQVFSANPSIDARIFCFTGKVYRSVASVNEQSSDDAPPRPPRVFLSYAGRDKSNARWVRLLAEKLRENGVDARIDIFHLKPGSDLPQWMANEVIQADKVLLVCDKFYIEKADFRTGGVGWETMLIQGDMLAQGDSKQKYIAILRADSDEASVPTFMRSKYAFSWGLGDTVDSIQLRELLLCLFDCELEPELGPVPRDIQIMRRKKHKKVSV